MLGQVAVKVNYQEFVGLGVFKIRGNVRVIPPLMGMYVAVMFVNLGAMRVPIRQVRVNW
jgi:hypothetical protein